MESQNVVGGDPEKTEAKPSESSSSSSAGSTNSDAHDPKQTPPPRVAAYMGKHRLSAAINFLNQQIQIVQDELDQLDTFGESSAVCEELISSIEPVPDALLPVTRGPMDVGWERWFQGAQSSRSRRKWM